MCNLLSAAILSAVLRSTLAIAINRRLQVGRGCVGISLFHHVSIICVIHLITLLLLFFSIILMVDLVIPSLLPISSQLAPNCLVVWYTYLKVYYNRWYSQRTRFITFLLYETSHALRYTYFDPRLDIHETKIKLRHRVGLRLAPIMWSITTWMLKSQVLFYRVSRWIHRYKYIAYGECGGCIVEQPAYRKSLL